MAAPGVAGPVASLWRRVRGRENLLRAGGAVSVVRVLGLACVFLLQVLLARVLGDPASYGSYAWGQSLLFFLGGVVALGMPLAASRFIAVLVGRGDETGARGVLRKARVHVAQAGLVLLSVAGAYAAIGPANLADGLSKPLLVLAMAGAPAAAWMTLSQQAARARGALMSAFLPTHVLRPLLTGGLAATAWGLVGAPLDPVACLTLVVTSVLFVTVIQEVLLRRRAVAMAVDAAAVDDSDYGPGRLLAVGLPILVTRTAGLLTKHSSTLLLGLLAGPAAAGAFFAASRLADLVSLPQQVASAVTQPMLARAHADRAPAHFERLAWVIAHMAFWPTLFCTLLMLLFGTSVLAVFGRDFAAALPVLALLLLANCIAVAFGASRDVLVMAGLQRPLSAISVIAALVHLAALVLLLPAYGPLGAAAIHCFNAFGFGIACAVLARRRAGVRMTLWDAFGLFSARSPPRHLEDADG